MFFFKADLFEGDIEGVNAAEVLKEMFYSIFDQTALFQ